MPKSVDASPVPFVNLSSLTHYNIGENVCGGGLSLGRGIAGGEGGESDEGVVDTDVGGGEGRARAVAPLAVGARATAGNGEQRGT